MIDIPVELKLWTVEFAMRVIRIYSKRPSTTVAQAIDSGSR